MQRRFCVYVIDLRSVTSVREVYVGSSAHTPQERFLQHKRGVGYAVSRDVRKRGTRIRYDLMPRSTFGTRKDAKHQEKQVRALLEHRGYKVHGACNRRESPRCVL